MKRVIEELLFQMLANQVMTFVCHLIEWLSTVPWRVWIA